jgi:trimeric autotransporter adhesin
MLKSIFAAIAIFIASIFGGHQIATAPSQPAAAVVAVVSNETPSASTTGTVGSQSSPAIATTTIVNQYTTQPVIERTIVKSGSGVTEASLDTKLAELSNSLHQEIVAQLHSPPSSVTTFTGNTIPPTDALPSTATVGGVPIATTQDISQSSLWTASGSNIYYNAGNVGIGTSSPDSTLTVYGTSTLTNLILGNGVSGSTASNPSDAYLPSLTIAADNPNTAGAIRQWVADPNDSVGAFYDVFASAGTLASPLAQSVNDYIWAGDFYSYNGTHYEYGSQMVVYANGAANGDGSVPSSFSFGWTNSSALDQGLAMWSLGGNPALLFGGSGGWGNIVLTGSDQFALRNLGNSDYASLSLKSLFTTGNVGVATDTPWRTLSVTGTVGLDGLTGSTGVGSLCLDSNKQLVYNSGSDNCLSSLRSTKHDITDLTLSGTSTVAALVPVSFIYNNDASSTVRYGFIAEDTAAVDSHLGTYDQAGNLSGVDDRSILSIIVKALQEIIGEVGNLTATVAGFAQSLTTHHLAADDLCLKKADGTPVCVTGDQLTSMLSGTGQSPSNPVQISSGSFTIGSSSPSSNESTTTSTTTDTAGNIGTSTITTDASSTPSTSPPTDATTSAATSTSQ